MNATPAPMVAPIGIVTADARKVTPRQFSDAMGFTCPTEREAYQQQLEMLCRIAIDRGDTYGFPAMLVARLREERLTDPVVTYMGDQRATVFV